MLINGKITAEVDVCPFHFFQELKDKFIKKSLHQYGLYDTIILSNDEFVGITSSWYNDDEQKTFIRNATEKEILIITSLNNLIIEAKNESFSNIV